LKLRSGIRADGPAGRPSLNTDFVNRKGTQRGKAATEEIRTS